MAHRVFEIRPKDRDKLEEALKDDTLGRQSLVTRDARTFGFPDRDTLFLFVEGEESAMLRAEALILEFGRRAADGEELRQKLKDEEDEAAGGLGFIMGSG